MFDMKNHNPFIGAVSSAALVASVSALLVSSEPARAAEPSGTSPQIVNVQARSTFSLDGLWKTIVDPYENGYYDYRRMPLKDEGSYFADKDFNADRTKL